MAGRKMTAWIAGLSFISANLSSLETMGWSAMAYQYGMLGAHAYLIGAIPAILFLAVVMMPFYYICKTHSVPGYLKLRYGEGSRVAGRRLVHLHDRAGLRREHVRHGQDAAPAAGLEHPRQHLGLLDHGGHLRGPGRAALRGVQRGAPVLPDLAGHAADPDPRPDRGRRLERHDRHDQRRPCTPANTDFTSLWANLGSADDNPMGMHWIGMVFGLGLAVSFGYWCTDFLQVQRVMAAKNLRAAQNGTIIGAAFKMLRAADRHHPRAAGPGRAAAQTVGHHAGAGKRGA